MFVPDSRERDEDGLSVFNDPHEKDEDIVALASDLREQDEDVFSFPGDLHEEDEGAVSFYGDFVEKVEDVFRSCDDHAVPRKGNPDAPRLAKAIRDARVSLGWKQRDLAAALEMSIRSISSWEKGTRPNRETNAGLLRVFARVSPPLLRELTMLLVGVDPGLPAPPIAPPSPKAAIAIDSTNLMETLVLRVAEDLDLGPRRVRAAIATVLDAIERSGLSPSAARAALQLKSPNRE